MTDIEAVALRAVQRYAESHPRPPHVNRQQAATMLHVSEGTVRNYIKSGALKLNSVGMIPISEIDRVILARAA